VPRSISFEKYDEANRKAMFIGDWYIFHNSKDYEILSNKEFISKYKVIE
jgi:hypothetical protein